MPKNTGILKNVVITPRIVAVDGKEILHSSPESVYSDYIRDIYKFLNCQYPKFYKMDEMCKLTFLGSELILGKGMPKDADPGRFAMFFSNRSSTLDTDMRFTETISSIPSPALFVYTLPNIAMGEVSIRHKITGENLFLVEEEFQASGFCDNLELLFRSTDSQYCLCGWTEFSDETDFKICMWLTGISGKKPIRPLSAHELATDFSMY